MSFCVSQSSRPTFVEHLVLGHDASIRIPLVLTGSGFRGGGHRHDLATNPDLVPTLVRAGGGDDPGLDGRALQDEAAAPDDVLVQTSESQIGRALRTTTHTYAVKAPTRTRWPATATPTPAATSRPTSTTTSETPTSGTT